jgi:glycosyltransferase involved in cell wall biosynthesis
MVGAFRSSKVKIAVFTERYPGHGGGISTAHQGLGELLATRNDVCFFAFEPSDQPSEEIVKRTRGTPFLAQLLGKALEWKVRRHAPRGVISAVAAIGRTAAAVRGLNRPLADFQPDFIIVSDDQVPLLGLSVPRVSKIIWVAHHNYQRFLDHPFLPVDCPYDLFLAHRLERRAVSRSHYAVFPSVWMGEVFRETLSNSLPGRVIRNVLPLMPKLPDRQFMRRSLGLAENASGIFLPSAGTHVKGARFVPELIRRISAEIRNAFFVISGPIYDSLAAELNLMREKFLIITEGSVPRERVLSLAVACDICVSPALLENYSCALLECQSLGLPVVTFQVGGNREIISHGQSGWVVEMANIDEMVKQATSLLRDTKLRGQMSEAAVRHAAKLSDRQTILADWEAVFNHLNAPSSGSGSPR